MSEDITTVTSYIKCNVGGKAYTIQVYRELTKKEARRRKRRKKILERVNKVLKLLKVKVEDYGQF